jgi:hypothetical protein
LSPELKPQLTKGKVKQERNEHSELTSCTIFARSVEEAKQLEGLLAGSEKGWTMTDYRHHRL